MIFVYSKWAEFCKKLNDREIQSVPACEVLCKRTSHPYIVLKHDVETKVASAYQMAKIEHQYGHRGSYYVQAYLLNNEENVRMLRQMQEMGHEVSYHYDVLDSNHGDMNGAISEFQTNLERFRSNGFQVVTVCQHGNPVIERVGYHSNRDFFRNERVQALYPDLADIMVDFKAKAGTDYLYFSDAGRRFNLIFDPINNDLTGSENKDVPCEDLDAVLDMINAGSGIVSVHPHRWTSSALGYRVKAGLFKAIRFTAKKMMKISLFKRIMGKYYYLAKKI